jgi:predicted nucleotidyltransferase component of viral defense system
MTCHTCAIIAVNQIVIGVVLEIQDFEYIKKLVIISMFSDDDLMDMLVLKGGNALDIIYKLAQRSSKDVDFSIANEFSRKDFKKINSKIERTLKNTFKPEGFVVFDVKLTEKPVRISPDMEKFWGGYQVEFKIIEIENYNKHQDDIESLRRNATVIEKNNRRTFRVDISKFEYCDPKKEYELEGYTIYVYSPEMIIAEKLRAICQQMPEYSKFVRNPSQSARARDFFDIYTVMTNFEIDLLEKRNKNLIKNIFLAKKVPLNLIAKIKNYREYHRTDFESVQATVKPSIELKAFDYYFDYVLKVCEQLDPLWKE